MKVTFVIYADKFFLLEKIHKCNNNPEKLSRAKTDKYSPCLYSFFAHCSFNTATFVKA